MNTPALADLLKVRVRTVRDWPRPGVNFRDVTPLFSEPELFAGLIGAMVAEGERWRAEVIAAVDARGFIIGGAVADRMHRPFAPVRKRGKLPGPTVSEAYALEYGQAEVEIHTDACRPGQRVLLVDDLIATGGTLLAAARLFQGIGGVVAGAAAAIDLPELGGSRRLRDAGFSVCTLCAFRETE